jgi:hypothetical protein
VQIRIANILLQRVVKSDSSTTPSNMKVDKQVLLDQAREIINAAYESSKKTLGNESIQIGEIRSIKGEIEWRLDPKSDSAFSLVNDGLNTILKCLKITISDLHLDGPEELVGKIHLRAVEPLFRKYFIDY